MRYKVRLKLDITKVIDDVPDEYDAVAMAIGALDGVDYEVEFEKLDGPDKGAKGRFENSSAYSTA